MAFYVKLANSEDFSLVEFQGVIEPLQSELKGIELGLLDFKHGDIIITIGNHDLLGKLIKLEKPIAILEKSEVLFQKPEIDPSTQLPVNYHIKGIVQHKILFSTRPRVRSSDTVSGVVEES